MALSDLADLVDLALFESKEPPPVTGLWTSRRPARLPPSPPLLPRHNFGLCANNIGDVYLYGGDTGDRIDDGLYHYSTVDNTATLLRCYGNSPGSRRGHAMTLVGNIIAIHGGTDPEREKSDSTLFLLNLVSREWTSITRSVAPGPRISHAMAAVGTTIYIFGGYDNGECLNELWAFNLDTLRTDPTWELIEPSSLEQPPPRRHCTFVTYQNQLILFGGWSGNPLGDAWSFDPMSRRWSQLQCTGNIPPPRYGHAATVLDNVMYVTSGIRATGSSNDVLALKIPQQRWSKLKNMSAFPIPRFYHGSICIGTKIFIFGGNTGNQEKNLIHILGAKYINDPDLHTLECLTELDTEFQATLAWERSESRARELKYELRMQQAKVGEIGTDNMKLKKRVTELDGELQTEKAKAQKLSVRIGEVQAKAEENRSENVELKKRVIELEKRVIELDDELWREKAKVHELDTRMGGIQVQNSKLEERMIGLHHNNNELKRIQAVTSILEFPSKMRSLAHLQGSDAQIMIDFLAELLERQNLLPSNADRRHILHLLTKLSKSAQVFPRCAELSLVQCNLTSPVNDEGGYGLIYKGVFKQHPVCVKAVRILDSGTKEATRILRAQAAELALLTHVSHPNVIPLFGAYLSSEARPRICIVSPWMENGDLITYLRNFPNAARIPLMSDLATGLGFLHDIGIIHADLKARNVLVSRSHRAVLADFGVSTVLTANVGSTSSKEFAGTIFWMAPEQLIPDDEGELSPPTQQSDMWGFACTCFEALSGRTPFSPPYTPSQLVGVFIKGQVTPLRPKRNGDITITDGGPLITLAERCWNYDPSQRPTAMEALQFITELNVEDGRPSTDEELAVFEIAKNGRTEVKIDYDRLLSIVRRK